MRPELAFLSLLVYKEHKIDSFHGEKCNRIIIFRKNLNLIKNYAKSEQNHAKYPVITQNVIPR